MEELAVSASDSTTGVRKEHCRMPYNTGFIPTIIQVLFMSVCPFMSSHSIYDAFLLSQEFGWKSFHNRMEIAIKTRYIYIYIYIEKSIPMTALWCPSFSNQLYHAYV